MSEMRPSFSGRRDTTTSEISITSVPETPTSIGESFFDMHRTGETVPIVFCRVCGAKIILSGYNLDVRFIVTCVKCKEATPIKPAPRGERYVRCACGCLMICRATARKVACPRTISCNRMISVVTEDEQAEDKARNELNEVSTKASHPSSGTCRLICAHCDQPFIFNITDQSLVKCPCCSKLSGLRDEHHRDQLRRSVWFALTVLIGSLVIIFVNSLANTRFAGEYILYVMLLVITMFSAIRPILAFRLGSSRIEGQI